MSKPIKRRGFLKAATLAAASTALAAPAIAQSSPKIRWRLTNSFPKSLENLYVCATSFSTYLSEATDGNFEVQVFAPGEVVPALQALDAVQNGTVECAHTAGNYSLGKENALAFGNGIPFGLNARQHFAWWHLGGGKELVNEAFGKFNVTALACGDSGAQMGGWFRKEIKGLEDLNGLKFRISGLGGNIMAKLGAVPQQIPAGDTYAALERGTLDAAEFSGPADDEKLGFVKVAKYYYAPSFWEGGSMACLIFNKQKLEELPKQYRALVGIAAEAASNRMIERYDWTNGPALRRLVAAGADVKLFPDAVMQAALKAANELYADLSSKNELFKRCYDSTVAYRDDVLPWWRVGEVAYDTFMARTRGRN